MWLSLIGKFALNNAVPILICVVLFSAWGNFKSFSKTVKLRGEIAALENSYEKAQQAVLDRDEIINDKQAKIDAFKFKQKTDCDAVPLDPDYIRLLQELSNN